MPKEVARRSVVFSALNPFQSLPVDQPLPVFARQPNPLPIDPPLCPSAHSLPTKMLTEIDHQSFRCLFPSSPHSLCSFTHSARQNARYSCPSTHSLTLPVYVLTVSAPFVHQPPLFPSTHYLSTKTPTVKVHRPFCCLSPSFPSQLLLIDPLTAGENVHFCWPSSLLLPVCSYAAVQPS
ncbi:hypothetical protein OUZ56_032733 [Daphnia magna]|uniref:Uncharacterized protein n=1 Tax=Daphnia magna TaxID=35525 RepID=A0ABQ9ZWZ8_9CRUS|nr:hypothetical protein OUZ56_032733 [Daphnia magna]